MSRVRSVLLLVVAAVLLVPAVASAQEAPPADDGLQMTTPFPRVAVEAGAQARFNLDITAPEPVEVSLTADGVPDGWSATFRGGGLSVDGVTAGPEAPNVVFDVSVPADAAEGAYDLSVIAEAANDRVVLPLRIRVSALAGGEVTLTPDFPGKRAPAGQSVTFEVELRNDTPADLRFEFSADGPGGWEVSAQPRLEAQASTIQVDSGTTATIEVEAQSPIRAEAGVYPVDLTVTAPGTQVETELLVEVIGSYSLDLTTIDERLNAEVVVGESTDLAFVLTNTGTAPHPEINLSARPPSGWEVTWEEQTIPALAPGEAVTLTATITPSEEAIAGDYVITFLADSEPVREQVDIRTTVNPSPLWGFVGIGLIALTLAGLAYVFRRFGRR